jgi:hypothetical protein
MSYFLSMVFRLSLRFRIPLIVEVPRIENIDVYKKHNSTWHIFGIILTT